MSKLFVRAATVDTKVHAFGRERTCTGMTGFLSGWVNDGH